MSNGEYFDVLTFENGEDSAEMVHSYFQEECLGSQVDGNLTRLFFTGGIKESIELKLSTLPIALKLHWNWEVQQREDWHLSWQDNFHPLFVEDKIAIVPSWDNTTSAPTVIKIKPGMAFGTGHHETTWLMLSLMKRLLKPGMSVLDLGTGSGILAITAHKLGAASIDAVEYDCECEQNFKENLELNQLTETIPFHLEDVLNWKEFNYDLITANLNRNVLQQLIPLLSGSPAVILLPGLLLEDFNFIDQHCKNNTLEIMQKSEKGEWLALEIQSK